MSRAVAGLAEIVLWVRDMETALPFYRDLFGLEVISPATLPNKFLKAADGADGVPEMIVLVPRPKGATEFPREKAQRVLHHMAFRVEAPAYDKLQERFVAAGVEVRSGVHPVLKGVRTFYVDDPDGSYYVIVLHYPAGADTTIKADAKGCQALFLGDSKQHGHRGRLPGLLHLRGRHGLQPPAVLRVVDIGAVYRRDRLGGLIHEYEIAA
jgi:catechol 2,3-dioxygenase-like lactoylglutathione lyase family enzyme